MPFFVVQMWAKRRGIYSNVMGFLGGVNFAILTTRTCLHYPNACAATIVRNFFRLFAAWDWAGAVPVMVTGIDRGGPVSDMVWDPTISMHQGREIFPIITPCYPASNSTFNVSVRCSDPLAVCGRGCVHVNGIEVGGRMSHQALSASSIRKTKQA